MPRVRVLPEVLAHKIAAGEIIERPASVVKELVENALDASARQVKVTVTAGGRKQIRVRDDGIGMTAEDARIAFQHHATSKIRTFQDLEHIDSLGFRGEALPSIASVSRLTLKTIAVEANAAAAGHQLELEGGQLRQEREISWPKGTEIQVDDLFFNVPARRKFLKSVPTELGHLTRQVTLYALAYPEVEFQLHHQRRSLISAAAVTQLEDRIFQVMGDSFLENLVPVAYRKDGIRVSGFASLPHEQRSNTRNQYLYVNRRAVRDRVITHAIRLAYRDLIPASAHPVILLFIDLDPVEVDVNVHPSKTEVRFQHSSRVHRAIYHAIEEALIKQQVSLASLARDVPVEKMEVRQAASIGVQRSVERYFQRQPDSSLGFPEFRRDRFRNPTVAPHYQGSDPHRFDIPETADLSPVPVLLGQFVESFLVAADREGVMVIDQHVAHERILYDRALRQLNSEQGCPIQRLLIPLTLELTLSQQAAAQVLLEQLNQNGFEVEWFGERTLVVKGIPEVAAGADRVDRLLSGLLDKEEAIPGDRNGAGVRRLREKIAINLSCRAAIKINTPLVPKKMRWLIDELFRCENPYTCPHGRPIVLRMNIEEILKGFKRI